MNILDDAEFAYKTPEGVLEGVTKPEIAALARSGQVLPYTPVRARGGPWFTAEDFPFLRDIIYGVETSSQGPSPVAPLSSIESLPRELLKWLGISAACVASFGFLLIVGIRYPRVTTLIGLALLVVLGKVNRGSRSWSSFYLGWWVIALTGAVIATAIQVNEPAPWLQRGVIDYAFGFIGAMGTLGIAGSLVFALRDTLVEAIFGDNRLPACLALAVLSFFAGIIWLSVLGS